MSRNMLSVELAAEVRERFGTPCYVYDQSIIEATARRALEGTRATQTAASIAGGLTEWDAAWQVGPVSRQRAMLGAVLESVAVAPAVRGRNRFDAGRLTLQWRD